MAATVPRQAALRCTTVDAAASAVGCFKKMQGHYPISYDKCIFVNTWSARRIVLVPPVRKLTRKLSTGPSCVNPPRQPHGTHGSPVCVDVTPDCALGPSCCGVCRR